MKNQSMTLLISNETEFEKEERMMQELKRGLISFLKERKSSLSEGHFALEVTLHRVVCPPPMQLISIEDEETVQVNH